MQANIAVVQFAIQPAAPAANLAHAEDFIEAAVANSADLIVFPEDFVTGPISANHALADYEGRYIQHFQRLASTYHIDIVPGSIIEGEGDDLYNTTYYIDHTGTIKGRYRKVNLWLSERSYLTPGSTFPVCETRFGKVGLLICWDLIFPEAFRTLVKQGVEIVICSSYWCLEDASVGLQHDAYAEIKAVDALCVARAFENEIILVYANAANTSTETYQRDGLFGHSQITAPFKGVLQMLPHAEEAMFVQTIDTTLLGDAEQAYEIRKDLQTRLRH